MAHFPEPPKLGEWLTAQGVISHDQLKIALTEQAVSGMPLGRQLISLGFISEAMLRDVLAHNAGEASIELSQAIADPEAIALLPEHLARRHRILPLAVDFDAHILTVAVPDLFNLVAQDQVRAHLEGRYEIRPVLAAEAQILEQLDKFYGFDLSVDGILGEIETGEVDWSSLQLGGEYTHPVVRLVNALLADAVKRGASDVHFEPEAAFLRVRYRIDGVLEPMRSLHRKYWPAIAVRLKVISGLNIAESRAPQDGRLSLTLYGRGIDFRVSSMPTLHGENIVLRVLDREKSIIALEAMGLPAATLARLQKAIARPEGLLIVSGPTGSGKTTTLYSLLSHLNREEVNIMTLEDPVEYPLPIIRQTSITELAKVDFPGGVRAIMRQDPDIILVGEVRDRDAAEMAFRAAMTGHLVLTTLHTHSVLGVFPRLVDMGIRPAILAGNIIAIIAQRLVRRLCPHCKEGHAPAAEEREALGESVPELIYRPCGCAHCANKGYKGRFPLMETLLMDETLDEAVLQGATPRELAALASERGWRSLAEDGLDRVRSGDTSLAEIRRVVDLTKKVAMPRFRYRAADSLGKHVSGELTAANDIDLDLRLRRMGLMLVRARLAQRRALFPGQRVTRRDLISFCFHIQQIARTNASLLDGLKDLLAGAENTRFRDLLILVVDDLEGGKLLSEALAAHPDVFDRVFLALVRAAEKSDQIETVFARLEIRLKQQDELQAELTRLLIYPSITALAVLAAGGVMLFYLTPRLATLVTSLNLPMPFATRLLVGLSELTRQHLPWLISLLLASAAAVHLAVRHSSHLAERLDGVLLRLPSIGPALKKHALARVSGLLALLLQSGVGLLEALAAGADSAGNRVIARKINGAAQQIAAGGGVSDSLRRQDLLPPLVLRMLLTGETNGALPEALENVAWFYQRDARETITRALKLLEPGLAALLGLLLALLLLAVFLPVYQIIGELPL